MDEAGVDAAVLSCSVGMKNINDAMKAAEEKYPGRFFGIAHAPAIGPGFARELKRCRDGLGFQGLVMV